MLQIVIYVPTVEARIVIKVCFIPLWVSLGTEKRLAQMLKSWLYFSKTAVI